MRLLFGHCPPPRQSGTQLPAHGRGETQQTSLALHVPHAPAPSEPGPSGGGGPSAGGGPSGGGPSGGEAGEAPVPANDLCADAKVIPLGATPSVDIQATTLGANHEIDAAAVTPANAAYYNQTHPDNAVRIIAPDAFLDVLAEGGGAPDFLGRSAQKVVLVRRSVAPAKAA